MDPTRNDPVADGVEGSADVIEKIASIVQTKATANRPIVAGIAVRRGPGGVAKGGLKAEWSITIADVCVDAPIRDRRLRSYEEFCAVIQHRYGTELAPMPQSEWALVVEAAIAEGGVV